MKTLITHSLKLKAEAYQVKRFGNYRPQKPLSKAIARVADARALTAGVGRA